MGAEPRFHHRRRAPHAGLGVGAMADLKPFTMPKWGIEMTEGTLAKWEVEEGKPYAKGDLLTLIETDKISNEVEAEADGCLVRLIAEEQETYNVGVLLGVIGPPGTPAAEIDAFISAFVPVGGSEADGGAAQDKPSEVPVPAPSPRTRRYRLPHASRRKLPGSLPEISRQPGATGGSPVRMWTK
jgi:pyruvate/2-oxoglutarate dehydrogenase complex dihydrolipoamide acyltransferase (E2) component